MSATFQVDLRSDSPLALVSLQFVAIDAKEPLCFIEFDSRPHWVEEVLGGLGLWVPFDVVLELSLVEVLLKLDLHLLGHADEVHRQINILVLVLLDVRNG